MQYTSFKRFFHRILGVFNGVVHRRCGVQRSHPVEELQTIFICPCCIYTIETKMNLFQNFSNCLNIVNGKSDNKSGSVETFGINQRIDVYEAVLIFVTFGVFTSLIGFSFKFIRHRVYRDRVSTHFLLNRNMHNALSRGSIVILLSV